MGEGTTSRLMAADRPYGDFYDYYVSPEYFRYTLVVLQIVYGNTLILNICKC
jgi:hypothetical protein